MFPTKTTLSHDPEGRAWITRSHGTGRARRRLAREGLDNARVRFNWGFHDGAADVRAGRPVRDVGGHFDRVYADAYKRGVEAARADEETASSDRAWTAAAWVDDFSGWA